MSLPWGKLSVKNICLEICASPPGWKVSLLMSLTSRGPGTHSLCSVWASPYGALSPWIIDGASLSPQSRQHWVQRDGWAGAVQTVRAQPSLAIYPLSALLVWDIKQVP